MLHVKELISSNAAISSAVEQVLPFWSMAGIKTMIKHMVFDTTASKFVMEKWRCQDTRRSGESETFLQCMPAPRL